MSDPIELRTTQQAAERVFAIRRLYHAGAVVRTAALLSLSVLHGHPEPGIRRLCERVAKDIDGARNPGETVAGQGVIAR